MKSKLEKPKTLRQLASRHWAEIERGTLLFDRQEREAAALRQLTKQDVTAFAQVRTIGSRGLGLAYAAPCATQGSAALLNARNPADGGCSLRPIATYVVALSCGCRF